MTVKIKLKKPLKRKFIVEKNIETLELKEGNLTISNKHMVQGYGKNLFSKIIIITKEEKNGI